MGANEWYHWLRNKSCTWKVATRNHCKVKQRRLGNQRMVKGMHYLRERGNNMLAKAHESMAEAHEAAMQCQALGIAGASGVLVVLCPERFCNGRSVCCLCLSKHSGSAGASTQHPAGGLQAHLERRGDAH